jgi:iron complex transport system ATP-binding protein
VSAKPQLLKASNVSFAYGDRIALREVSVDLGAGELVAILGPNGSGKSTLIRALLGHLDVRSGAIEWEGRALHGWRRRELARRVAYLPQSPTADVDQTVADVLRVGRAPYWQAFGIESGRDETVVRDVAAQLQLTELLSQPVAELSGGQRQRVFIGRCLVQEPGAMLLDEPNTFLDLRHQVELLRLLRKLTKERGLGVLMASHDVSLAGAHADRLIVLDRGKIAAHGPPADVLRAEVLAPVFEVEMETIARPSGVPIVVPK